MNDQIRLDDRKQYLLNVAIEEGERRRLESGCPVHIPGLVKDKDYARAARLRLNRAQVVTNELELARLEMRLDRLSDAERHLATDCLKAIMELRIKREIKNLR
jgi:hypothetical protein